MLVYIARVCFALLFSAHDNVPHDYKNTSADGHPVKKMYGGRLQIKVLSCVKADFLQMQ